MHRQNTPKRSQRNARRCLATLGGLALLNYSVEAQLVQTYQNFTTDPNWIGVGNTTSPQNFGYSATDNTGTSVQPPIVSPTYPALGTTSGAGEFGGTVRRLGSPASFYGANIGALNLSTDAFTVRGVIRVVSHSGSSGYFLGYSRGAASYGSGGNAADFIGIQFDDSVNAIDLSFSTGGGRDRATGAGALSDGVTAPFSMKYDPTANGGNGQMVTNVNGTILTYNLAGGQKASIQTLTNFGIMPVSAGDGSKGGVVFIDDLDYTTQVLTAPPTAWVPDAGGSWGDDGNWTQHVPNSAGAQAQFTGAINAPRTIFADSGVTVGTLTFNNTNTYNITGAGSLTLQGSGAGSAGVNVQAGTQKINLPLFINSNTTFNVSGGATLKISDPVTISSGKTLTQVGTVVYESTVTMLGASEIAEASSAMGSDVLHVNNLSMASDSKLDIGNNSAIIGSNSAASITSLVKSGFNGGDWNGNGITSSEAAADASHSTGVGIADSGDGGALVKFTYYGDANLDGVVNSEDFAALATRFGGDGLWNDGDFNYDGIVNALDFGALAGNFGKSGAGAAGAMMIGSLVPEPNVLALTAAGLFLSGLRRRARSSK